MKMVPFLMLKSPFRNRRNTVFCPFGGTNIVYHKYGSFEWGLQ